jgi:GT2 family glycosyltransferase
MIDNQYNIPNDNLCTSIIILTHNQIEYTQQCLNSILKYTPQDLYELIIIDNHSEDGTVQYLKEFQKSNKNINIKLIFNEENLGFPKGCNLGIKESNKKFILFLNNDTVVTNNWLLNLLNCINTSNDIGAVGPVTNYCSNYQSININYNNLEEMQLFAKQYNISDERLWEERLNLIGYCLLVRRKVLDEIGYFDENFSPGNYEDDDLSLRIFNAGYKLILCKDTFIHHHGSKSFSSNNNFLELLERNSKKFENKWGFNRDYSLFIRNDLINLIPENISQDNNNLNFLEVGCACGATLLKIKNIYKNANLYGIELNKSAAKIASQFAEILIGDVENLDIHYPKGFFNYILLPDILEHLKDPWTFLKKIKFYLDDNGSILSSIPNVMHISVIKQILNGRWQYSNAGILDKTHLRFFTLNEMIEMFTQSGFKVLKIYQNLINPNKDENELINNINILLNLPGNIIEQFKVYQYIFEVKKDNNSSYM